MEGRVGRNDPCPCGSGKKYKKCCMPKDTASQTTYVDPYSVMRTCAWCGKEILEDSEIYSLSAKALPKMNIERHAGKAFYIALLLYDKSVPVIVPTNDSDAKRDGKDMLFSICSKECGIELKSALNREKGIIGSVN